MKRLLIIATFSMVSSLITAQINILPTPSTLTELDGVFIKNENVITVEKGAFAQEEFLFLQNQFAHQGVDLKESNQAADIKFHWLKMLLPEAYNLEISDQITIESSSAKGRFYAMLSLLQLVISTPKGLLIKKLNIEDAPKFSWRGLHLDVSRHFFSVEEVKRFLDLMALYKFNTFHWHLTDDQGWRIEIKQYPKLTTIGGFRDSTLIGHYTDTPRRFDRTRYGGFYTQEQIKEVVEYASQLHINVVPEIEMPGHSRAALAAYPELSCTGEKLGVPGLWGVFEDIYCCNEETITFLQNVLEEVLELFPSEYIHIGGDEAPKIRWNESEDCKKIMEDNDLEDAHELQSYFIKRMDSFLTERGRKLIGWDEILEGGLSPNAAVMSWRGEEGGIAAAKQGHYVVMSPTTYCYFDYYQSSHESEPLAIGGFLPLEKVYQFDPIPEELNKSEAKYVLGGQANVWTEYIPTFEQVEYMVYPRAIALIQSLWCQNKPDYEEFLDVYLEKHENFLGKRNVNFSKSVHIPKLQIERVDQGVAYSWHAIQAGQTYAFSNILGNVVGGTQTLSNGESVILKRGTLEQHLALSFGLDRHLNYTVHRSNALGADVELLTKPHPKYNNNGGLNLVDGIQGSERWKGDQWLGFNEEEIEFVVNLDSISSIERVKIGFLNQNGSWIYLPRFFEVHASKDGEKWEKITKHTVQETDKIVRPELVFEEAVSAKYIRFFVKPLKEIPQGKGGAGNTPWTFIDEIQIFTDEN